MDMDWRNIDKRNQHFHVLPLKDSITMIAKREALVAALTIGINLNNEQCPLVHISVRTCQCVFKTWPTWQRSQRSHSNDGYCKKDSMQKSNADRTGDFSRRRQSSSGSMPLLRSRIDWLCGGYSGCVCISLKLYRLPTLAFSFNCNNNFIYYAIHSYISYQAQL